MREDHSLRVVGDRMGSAITNELQEPSQLNKVGEIAVGTYIRTRLTSLIKFNKYDTFREISIAWVRQSLTNCIGCNKHGL